ncbi:trypsin-like peptidase domain-containing protein [Streptomyces sp. NPDC102467]|uniref:trypsin-like peptidase domain-containing protein n=1 Tax=Streptomyces sp. NPDC102467 TaxID=3366179 RepID=UPI00382806F5
MTAIHQGADLRPLGSGFVIDSRRVITCAHVVHDGGRVCKELWVAFPKAEELMHLRLRVEEVVAPPVQEQDLHDVAVLVLEDDVAMEYVAPLRRPAARDLVDSSWWSFGFPDGRLGNSAAGNVGEALAYGWVRLDTESRYPVQPGYSGAALWSAEYEAVVGLVGQARQGSGDARALTLRAADMMLPTAKLSLLTEWTVQAAGDVALSAWGWSLAGDEESGRHWRPRARGVSTDAERGFRFRGRAAALEKIKAWISTPLQDRRQVLLVTGSPGVGKSAVLGRVVTTADPQIARALPTDDVAVRSHVGSVACAVHARDKTAIEVAREIATAASAALPGQASELPDLLRTRLQEDERGIFCVVIDALDEASTPEDARQILQTAVALTETCADLDVRVVVGSRRVDDAGDLLTSYARSLHVVDLDEPEFFAREDLVSYALATLQMVGDERVGNPYNDTATAMKVSERIADMAQGNFLIAGLVARSHGMHDQQAVSVARLQYTVTVETALREYLTRLPDMGEASAEALLTALAYAESPGLPAGLWRVVVHALTDVWVDEQDLRTFARSAAANFLVESSEAVTSTGGFRLFHQALNEALLRHRARSTASKDDERSIARALIRGVNARWATAPSYVLRSLPGHAVRGGIIDELLADDSYPLHADLRRLVPAAKAASRPAGRTRARLLRKTPQALEAVANERIALFTVTEAREQLGFSYRDQASDAITPYHAQWAVGAPHAEDIVLEGHTGWINALCSVPLGDRMLLASASNDHTIRLWDPDTGEALRVLAGHTGPVRTITAVSNNGRTLLASGGSDHTVQIWDPATGHHIRTIDAHTASVNDLCAIDLGDRMLLASASNDHTIKLWDPETADMLHQLPGDIGPVRTLTSLCHNNEILLVSAGDDCQVRFWDPAAGRHLRAFPSNTSWITDLSPVQYGDQTLLALASNDKAIQLWDPATGHTVDTITHHADWVRALATIPTPARTLVASGGHDNAVRLWNSHNGELLHAFEGHTDWVTSVCPLQGQDHVFVASAGNDNAIRLWDAQATPPLKTTDEGGGVTAVCAIPCTTKPLLASAESNDCIYVRNATTGEVVRTLQGHDDWVRSMCPLPINGQTALAAGGDNHRIFIWDPATGALLRTLNGHEDAVSALRPVAVGGSTLLVSASSDRTVRLWDPARHERCIGQAIWDHAILAMETIVIDTQEIVATGHEDGSISLWDPHKQRRVREWDAHNDGVTALATVTIGEDTLLASAGEDRFLHLWNPNNGQPVHRFDGHTDKITTLTPVTIEERAHLVSTSDDRTVRVWDLKNRRATTTVAVHSPAWASADCDDSLVVGLSDGILSLHLW